MIERIDATRGVLFDAVAQARGRLAGRQGTGLLYFAGHGLQLDWRNHLVPVDARLDSAADVPTQTLEGLVAAMAAPRSIILMVPAGKPVDDMLAALAPFLQPDDLVIDAGFPVLEKLVPMLGDAAQQGCGSGIDPSPR